MSESKNIITLEEATKLYSIDKGSPNILFIGGIIGNIEQKKEGFVELSVATKLSKEETAWVRVTAANPLEGQSGMKLADFYTTYGEKGMKVAFGCKANLKDDKYLNIFIRKHQPFYGKSNGEESKNIMTLEEAEKLYAIDRGASELLFIGGIIGNIEKKSENLVELSIATRPFKDGGTHWVRVKATNPMEGQNGMRFADFYNNHGKKGMKVSFGCKAMLKDDKYLNIFIRKHNPIFEKQSQ